MLQPAPADTPCPQHPHSAAAWICPRCGSFFCSACEHRTRPDALPMCPGCWALREERVHTLPQDKPSTALQTTGLVLGIFSIFPFPTLQFVTLVISILGLLMAKTPEQKKARWRSWCGLGGLCLGLLFYVVVFINAAAAK